MKKIVFLMLLLVIGGSLHAQRYGTNRFGGVNRQMQPSQPVGKSKPMTPEEQLDNLMVRLNSELKLDALQEAAIRNIYRDQMARLEGMRESTEYSDPEKRGIAMELSEKTDKEVTKLLSPDQIVAYEKMKKDMRGGKKSKRKNKDKDKEKNIESAPENDAVPE